MPRDLTQNPSPHPLSGQEALTNLQSKTNEIMAQFLKVLPSNYVSQINGPFYTLQFQALAEQLAKIICTVTEVSKDSDYDFTRTEFLWQIIGALVFPSLPSKDGGVPVLDGDVDYRTFLQRMILLLLQGSTPATVTEGAGLLTVAEINLIEKFLSSRDQNSSWSLDDQFAMEVNIEHQGGTAFPPEDPFVLQENIRLILEALKPAHTLYDYRHLFRDAFGAILLPGGGTGVADDGGVDGNRDRPPGSVLPGISWELSSYYYDDLRKYCLGAKNLHSSSGETLSDRTLFRDTSLSFSNVEAGALLVIPSGPNIGRYTVQAVLTFISDDSVLRPYTTSPTGLTGTAVVTGGAIVASPGSQDFGASVEGEVLTFSDGPNAGDYRLETLLGSTGGPVGVSVGPSLSVRPSPGTLRLGRRMPVVATGQGYEVTVDRLGASVPKEVVLESATEQFYL